LEKLGKHWTARSTDEFVYRISSDFIAQLQNNLESQDPRPTYSELARRIRVTLGRVSQVFNDPGNLTLKGTVKFAQAFGLKVAIVAYDDGDRSNDRGPINPEIFDECWKRAGSPRDFFELANSTGIMQQIGVGSPPVQGSVHFSGMKIGNGSEHFRLDTGLCATNSSAVN
jgi:hypothetical protein